MRIALTVGHSLLKNGSYTSASGEDCGGVNEYKYNKKLMKKVKRNFCIAGRGNHFRSKRDPASQ